jgi:hypothetical protein
MRIEIDHTLNLTVPPGFGQMVLHLLLTPASGPSQTVDSWSVEVAGIGNAGRLRDGYGNAVHLVNQPRPEGEVAIAARGVVTTRDINGVLGRTAGEPVPALYKRVTALTKAPADLMDGLAGHKGRLDLLHGLMGSVGEALGVPETAKTSGQMQATGEQSQSQSQSTEAADQRSASDYAHMFIGAARALDIPARYVCGYLAAGDGQDGGVHAGPRPSTMVWAGSGSTPCTRSARPSAMSALRLALTPIAPCPSGPCRWRRLPRRPV